MLVPGHRSRELGPEELGDALGAKDARAAQADAQLTLSPSSHGQLIFSLTQPPTCGAELALDDIVFRNCGLPGEPRIC